MEDEVEEREAARARASSAEGRRGGREDWRVESQGVGDGICGEGRATMAMWAALGLGHWLLGPVRTECWGTFEGRQHATDGQTG